MSRYALVENNAIIRIDGKPYPPYDTDPRWREVIDNPQAYDTATQNRAQNPWAQWVINVESVEVTYTITAKTPEELTAYKLSITSIDTLEVTAWEIPADGNPHVIARYYSQSAVNFVVDDGTVQIITVEPDENFVAELALAATSPGVITVSVKDKRAVIVATEVAV
jgi:hypothetical protein